ncbi:MAG: hypothetical protein O3C21_02575 [Verrucomicrobia bacterium]|nr:hypothetical protein [Verrucomicrobiota bacterium]
MKHPILTSLLFSAHVALGFPVNIFGQTIYEQMKVRSPTPTVNHLTKLHYAVGKFLALGENATILSSDDGKAWNSHASGYTRSISDIAFGNGVYVVCGSDNSTVLTSFDLELWEISRPGGIPFNNYGITFQNGLFYMCGSDGMVASSADGVEWSSVSTGVSVNLHDILFAGGQFIAVGADNTILTSADGQQWTLRPTGVALDGLKSGLLSVSYLNDQYVVGGKDGTVLTSPNGINWTHRPYTGNEWFWGGIYQNGAYYLTGRQGSLIKTPDFIEWEKLQIFDRGDNDLYGILTAEGVTVAVGRSGTIASSPDLVTWASHKGGYEESFGGLAFANGLFVLSDYDGKIRTSADSLEWQDAYTMPDELGIYDMIYADGKFVAVSYGSEIVQSVDGRLW